MAIFVAFFALLSAFKFYRLDLESYSEIKKIYKSYKIGTVLHLGAQAGVTRESGWLYFIDKDGDVSRAKMARGRK